MKLSPALAKTVRMAATMALCSAASNLAAQTAAPVRAAPDRFAINAYDVVGVTKLPVGVIETLVYPFAGPDRTAGDVEAARKALEDAYRSRGFESVLVEIPPQPNEAFVAGVVQLKVTEAAVGRLRVTGSKYHALSVVTAAVPALKEGEVPDLRQAQVELAAANRYPDREITPSIRAGKVPGTIDVELRVRDSLPFHASVNANNDHSASTTALRVGGSARYTNLWEAGHTLSLAYQGSPQSFGESSVISGSYLAPIAASNWSVLTYAYKSNSDVAALGGTQVLGNGYAAGVRAIRSFPGQGITQSVSFGFDYKDFKEDITIPSTDPAVPPTTIQTPIAYVPATASYTVQRATENSSAKLTIGVTAGIRQFGSGDAVIQQKRLNAIGNFVKLNLDAEYNRTLARDIIAVVRVGGQLADSPLVTNEQYSIGGATSLRGYYLAEGVGDTGINGSIELRSPSFAGLLGRRVDELRLFGFVDAGYARVLDPLPDQTARYKLVSIGGGARFQLFKVLTGNVAYGVALSDGATTTAGDGLFVFAVEAAF